MLSRFSSALRFPVEVLSSGQALAEALEAGTYGAVPDGAATADAESAEEIGLELVGMAGSGAVASFEIGNGVCRS